MGFFTKPGESAASVLEPLTKARIQAALESKGWTYKVDSDGDIGGGWEDGFFYFFTTGRQQEILLVRGTWYPTLPAADYEKAAEIANQWNLDKLWPKVYARRNDDGDVRLHGEHIVDYEHGLTDEQLLQHLVTVISAGCEFFEHLNEQFPEAAAAAKES